MLQFERKSRQIHQTTSCPVRKLIDHVINLFYPSPITWTDSFRTLLKTELVASYKTLHGSALHKSTTDIDVWNNQSHNNSSWGGEIGQQMQNLAKRDGDFWQSSILSNFNCSLMFLSSLSSCFAASADLIALSRGDLRSSSFPDITTSSSYSAHTHTHKVFIFIVATIQNNHTATDTKHWSYEIWDCIPVLLSHW